MFTHVLNKQVAGNESFLHKRIENLSPEQRWTVSVKPYKSTRSLDQNSRLWKLYNDLGAYIGHTPDEVHLLMGYKFLRELKTVGGEAVEVIKSTTKLNTKDMTVYQENIERWASEIGFEFKDKS